ncbi:Uncharacterised protein [Streptococcus pneumoniae]|nr:Uncharacterised protein [Streptococcus pneumoniae]
MCPSGAVIKALYSGFSSKIFLRFGMYLSIKSSTGIITPFLAQFIKSTSEAPSLWIASGKSPLEISKLRFSAKSDW